MGLISPFLDMSFSRKMHLHGAGLSSLKSMIVWLKNRGIGPWLHNNRSIWFWLIGVFAWEACWFPSRPQIFRRMATAVLVQVTKLDKPLLTYLVTGQILNLMFLPLHSKWGTWCQKAAAFIYAALIVMTKSALSAIIFPPHTSGLDLSTGAKFSVLSISKCPLRARSDWLRPDDMMRGKISKAGVGFCAVVVVVRGTATGTTAHSKHAKWTFL